MLQSCPVSELKDKFWDIKVTVSEGQPVFLTQDGQHTMVILSVKAYSELTDATEAALDEADLAASRDPRRLTHEEVFMPLREKFHVR